MLYGGVLGHQHFKSSLNSIMFNHIVVYGKNKKTIAPFRGTLHIKCFCVPVCQVGRVESQD